MYTVIHQIAKRNYQWPTTTIGRVTLCAKRENGVNFAHEYGKSLGTKNIATEYDRLDK